MEEIYKNHEFLVLAGCGGGKNEVFEKLSEQLQKKTTLINVAYTNVLGWKEAVERVRGDDRFNGKKSGSQEASQWLEETYGPSPGKTLMGFHQILRALEMDVVETVLFMDPAPMFPCGFKPPNADEDMEDFVERLCEERGVKVVRVHDVDSTTRMFMCHTGGIAAYLHYSVDPELFEAEEEEVASALFDDDVTNVTEQLGLEDVFGDDDSLNKTSSSSSEKKKKKPRVVNVSEVVDDDIDDFFGDDDCFGFNVSRTPSPKPAKKPKKKKKPKEKLPPGKDNVNLVFCGHVDAGKSTTVGHLLVQMKEIDEREVERMKKQDRADRAFAHLLDTDEEERTRGVTVECGYRVFESTSRHYTIVDAPGHMQFVTNFTAGANQGDIAVLLLSARANEFEDGWISGGTKEHCRLVRAFGMSKIVLAVNKMDTCGWSQDRYTEIVSTTTRFLKKHLGFDAKYVYSVPISGFQGLNLTQPADVCAPWNSTCLLDTLNKVKVKHKKLSKQPNLRVTVNSRKQEGKSVEVVGRVESGVLRVGDRVVVAPEGSTAKVSSILANEKSKTEYARPGDQVIFTLKGLDADDFRPGSLVCHLHHTCTPTTEITANIEMMKDTLVLPGFQCFFHAHSTVAPCEVVMVAQGSLKKEHDGCEVQLRFTRPVAVEVAKQWKRLGCFVLRDQDTTVAIGKILKKN